MVKQYILKAKDLSNKDIDDLYYLVYKHKDKDIDIIYRGNRYLIYDICHLLNYINLYPDKIDQLAINSSN